MEVLRNQKCVRRKFAPEVTEDAKKLFQLTDNNTIVVKLHIEIGNITI